MTRPECRDCHRRLLRTSPDGYGPLRAEAERSCDRFGALAALDEMHAAAIRYLPAEAVGS